MGSRCSEDEIEAILNGTAILKDWILVGYEVEHGKTAEEEKPKTGHHGDQIPLLGDW